jgi:hypothetical protein
MPLRRGGNAAQSIDNLLRSAKLSKHARAPLNGLIDLLENAGYGATPKRKTASKKKRVIKT